MSGRFSRKKMTIFNISTKQIVVVLMAWSRTANAINLLEMADGPGQESHYHEVEAVQGGLASLPCDLIPSQPGDSVYLVLWYKKDDKTPIYSYDSRASSMGGGAPDLWSEPSVFGDRAIFRDFKGTQPAVLTVSAVTKFRDEGEYTCRVDFRQSPTKYHRVRLSVIVPPQKPIIMDQTGQKVEGEVLGPLNQGQAVTLDCHVTGGDPLPSVYWYRNEKIIDDSDMKTFEKTVKNRIVLSNLKREDLGSRYRCLAINNNLNEPTEASLKIDILFPPLAVKISTDGSPFAVGKDYFVRCITWGSNPPATLSWSRTNGRRSTMKHLKVVNETTLWNFTESVLLYHPRPGHHGHMLTCSAVNSHIKIEETKEDRIKLEIFFPPTVGLHIGKALNLNDLEEGDDVYFECSIVANPPAYKVTWLHNGKEIIQKSDMQMFISNQSLVLQKVTRKQAGNYSCHASNVEGDAESAPVTLTIMYVPVCDETQDVVYGVSENESVSVSCSVNSYPPADAFTWSFNNSLTSTLLPTSSFTSSPGRSVINYTPHSHMDFGTLLCWGTNMVGNQQTNKPCVFHIIPTGPPDAPRKCFTQNQTATTVSIQCTPGYSGGLAQQVHVEVYTRQGVCIANLTDHNDGPEDNSSPRTEQLEEAREIYFSVDKLPPEEHFKIVLYASNIKGRSVEKYMEAHTLVPISGEKVVTDASSPTYSEEIPTLAVVFVGATITVLILVAALIVANTLRRRITIKQEYSQDEMQIKNIQNGQNSGSTWRQVQNSEIQQDKSPDIIKDTKGEVSKYDAMTTNPRSAEKRPLYNRGKNGFNAVPKNGLSQHFREEMSGNPIANGVMSPPDGGFGQLTNMSEDSHFYEDSLEPSDLSEYDQRGQHHKFRRNPDTNGYQGDSQGQRSSYPAYAQQMYDYQMDGGAPYSSLPRQTPPNSLMLGGPDDHGFGFSGLNSASITRLGLPLCDGITVNRTSLRTPLLEDDRESCV